MNLFEGLDDQHQQQLSLAPHQFGAHCSNTISGCSSLHELLLWGHGRQPVLLSVPSQPGQGGPVISLRAQASPISGPATPGSKHPQPTLLCACYQPSTWRLSRCLQQPVLGPCLLALFKQDCSLKLCAVPTPAPDPATVASAAAASHSQLQVLAEFSHPSFAGLSSSSCHIAAGPLLLLQPAAWQLALVLPMVQPEYVAHQLQQQPPAQSGHTTRGAHNLEGVSAGWQLLELDLPSVDLMQTVRQHFPDVFRNAEAMVAMAVPAAPRPPGARPPAADRSGGSWQSCIEASGPWQVLHSSWKEQQDSVELLLALPVQHVDGTQHRHPQQQQVWNGLQQANANSVLLLWLQVSTGEQQGHSGACHQAAEGAAAEGAGIALTCCYALPWHSAPSCAAVFGSNGSGSGGSSVSRSSSDSGTCQHAVAVGCSSGELQLLLVKCHSPCGCTLAPGCTGEQQHHHHRNYHWQQQQQACLSACSLQASAGLGGAACSLAHLPLAFISGASRRDILAVLHATEPDSSSRARFSSSRSSSSSSSMAVSFLAQRGNQLEVLSVIQGAIGLCAPACWPPGLLCNWQQHQQHAADGSILHLAAVIMTDKYNESVTGLDGYAQLDAGPDLPVSLVGVLLHDAPAKGAQPASAHAGMTAVSTADALQGAAGSSSSSELKGLQAILTVLEERWQQETRDLCALQQRVFTRQCVAAAVHQQLCQMAADTLQQSIARQYTLPLSKVNAANALAIYHAGRQIAGQQQQQVVVVPRASGEEAADMQLNLQLVSITTSWISHQLQMVVCLKPVLQCMHQQQQMQRHTGPANGSGVAGARAASNRAAGSSTSRGNGTSDSASSSSYEWWGALLQPCHAELLLWHAGMSAVTASSTWTWDAVSGQLTLTCLVDDTTLLRLVQHDQHSFFTATSRNPTNNHQGLQHTATRVSDSSSCHCRDADDGYVGVASAMAAAAAAAVGSSHHPCCSSSSTGFDALQLHAAVVVAACCSSQAVVQWEIQQQQQQQQPFMSGNAAAPISGVFAGHMMQRSQLLAPAMAVLHLQPLEVSVMQLLVQAADGTCASTGLFCMTRHKEQQQEPQPGAAGQSAATTAAAATDSYQNTPSKARLRSQPSGQADCACGGNEDVIPPTPCSADDMEDGLPVIPDSEEDSEQATDLQPATQCKMAAAAAAGPDALGTNWQDAPDNKGIQLPTAAGPAAGAPKAATMLSQSRSLLLLSESTDLYLLAQLLQQPGTGLQPVDAPLQHAPGRSTSDVSKQQGSGSQQQLVLQTSGSSSCSGLELIWLSKQALLAKLASTDRRGLEALQQLLLTTLHQMPQGGCDVRIQAGLLDPTVHASYIAATDALSDAVRLHVKVLEETLQQRMATHSDNARVATVAVAPSTGQENLPPGSAAAGDTAKGSCQLAPGVGRPGGSLLVVDGSEMGCAVSECWVSCYNAQVGVDLAMAQLGLPGM